MKTLLLLPLSAPLRPVSSSSQSACSLPRAAATRHSSLFTPCAAVVAATLLLPLSLHAQQFRTNGNTNLSTNLGSVYVAGTNNLISSDAGGAFIGGGRANTISARGNYSFIGGGDGNFDAGSLPDGFGKYAVIGGGQLNVIEEGANYAVIGGGYGNAISTNSLRAFIGAGARNLIGVGGVNSVIVGGFGNTVTGRAALIFGGFSNSAAGTGSTVLGGYFNQAVGNYSFVAGNQGRALHNGTFIWSDGTTIFQSTTTNQFLIRAAGGVGINTNNPGTNALSVKGRALVSGDLQVTGNILGSVSNSNAALNNVSASNAFTIQTGGTVAWFASAQGTNASSSFAGNFAGRNIIAGHPSNSVAQGIVGATIGGGGGVELGETNAFNIVTANFGTIGGGYGNRAGGEFSFIGGGDQNQVTALYGAVGAGFRNQATAGYSFVGAGDANIAGGSYATVAGGRDNQAAGNYASIPGGSSNVASGTGSFAAGVNAKATNDYSFVWGGSPTTNTTSYGTGTFTVRAPGGAKFLTSDNDTFGVQLSANGAGWSSISDSNAKTTVEPVDHRQTLNKLAGLPVTQWRYKHDPSRRYIGPMAQDFHAAFGLGSDDKTISTLDTDGVTLSAIKGLMEEMRELDEILEARERRIESIEAEIQALRGEIGL